MCSVQWSLLTAVSQTYRQLCGGEVGRVFFFFLLPFLSSLILVMDQSQMNNIWQLAHPLPGSDLPLSSECLPLFLNGWLSERIKWCLKKHTDIIIKGTPTLTSSWELSSEFQLFLGKGGCWHTHVLLNSMCFPQLIYPQVLFIHPYLQLIVSLSAPFQQPSSPVLWKEAYFKSRNKTGIH